MSASAVVDATHTPPLLSPERRRYLETKAMSGLAGRLAERRAWRSERLHSWWRYRVYEDRANAFHEASHAIVNEVQGRFTHLIRLVDTQVGDRLIAGFTSSSDSAAPPISLALPSSLPTDRENVASACVELGRDWRGAIREYHRLHRQAETLVVDHWPAIRAVAKALSEQRTLDRAAFLAVLETHQNQQQIEIAATSVAVHNHA